MALSLSDLLKRMLEMNGSDLHITTNSPPQIRVHGHLVPLEKPVEVPYPEQVGVAPPKWHKARAMRSSMAEST